MDFFKRSRSFILAIIDAALTLISYLMAMAIARIVFSEMLSKQNIIFGAILAVGIYIAIFYLANMYANMWRYAHTKDFLMCYVVSLIAGIAFNLIIYFTQWLPSVFTLFFCFIASTALTGIRILYFAVRTKTMHQHLDDSLPKKQVLLIGAGNGAELFLHETRNNPNSDMNIVCIVDDDPEKLHRKLGNVKVEGTIEEVPSLWQKYLPDIILLAIPSIDTERKREIITMCSKLKSELLVMDDVYQLVTGRQNIRERVHRIEVEDLLGRDPVMTINDIADISYVQDQIVMVTGGGGSIGSELCRQIALLNPRQLIIVDIYENNAYDIQQEFVRKYENKFPLSVEIASVRDLGKMRLLFQKYHPQIVFHAAAHKHVPLMENNPEEAVKNNVMGTYHTAVLADEFGVKRFILISTDKAVNPTNFMGASKRCAELIIQSLAQKSKTTFAAVRFGNVLGSNGSVVPLFKRQIANGGPVTVTHPDINRYFMTIPEAVALVLKAGELARGGEIFILNMGRSMKILELAEMMIRFVGLTPYKDIPIQFTGLRPGEKLTEELRLSEEGMTKTQNDRIFIAKPVPEEIVGINVKLKELENAAYQENCLVLRNMMQNIVSTYQPMRDNIREKQEKNAEIAAI